jgi:hypothetical protein
MCERVEGFQAPLINLECLNQDTDDLVGLSAVMSGHCRTNLSWRDKTFEFATTWTPHLLENFKTRRSTIFEDKRKAAVSQAPSFSWDTVGFSYDI